MTTIAEKKNKSMLIAQIGRGTYLNTNYAVLHERISSADAHQYKIDNLAAYQTGYTFEAVLHELQYKKDTDIDTVLLIGTSTSYWGSLSGSLANLRFMSPCRPRERRMMLGKLRFGTTQTAPS